MRKKEKHTTPAVENIKAVKGCFSPACSYRQVKLYSFTCDPLSLKKQNLSKTGFAFAFLKEHVLMREQEG